MSQERDARRGGLNELSANPDSSEIERYYDKWAAAYDDDLRDWNYQAPREAAALLRQAVPLDGRILDAGCGTGLTGAALSALGYQRISGLDISQASLALAQQTGAYETLTQVDLTALPLPYETNAFAGVQCVGVLTYVPDTNAILREFCRIVQPGGAIVFTQRDDLFIQRNDAQVLQTLEEEGLWQKLSLSVPHPYLPKNADYADKIQVLYCLYRVA